MSSSPPLKIFNPEGEYIGCVKGGHEAALLAWYNGPGSQVRLGHAKKHTLFTVPPYADWDAGKGDVTAHPFSYSPRRGKYLAQPEEATPMGTHYLESSIEIFSDQYINKVGIWLDGAETQAHKLEYWRRKEGITELFAFYLEVYLAQCAGDIPIGGLFPDTGDRVTEAMKEVIRGVGLPRLEEKLKAAFPGE